MRIIAEAREDVAKCWGKQRLSKTDYRPLLYLVRTECNEGTLVLNTVTGQMVLLTADELAALDALPGPLPEILLPLMEAHYVVPVDFDEKKSVQQLRALLLRLNRKKEITSYTILPTTACNARCFYCYEANYAHHTMTEETANQVVEFIAAHCGAEKKVFIEWFGGEPMVGRARIDQICEGLQAREISFKSNMISNGYLYTQELAQHAADAWNLKHIQITLDGTEDVYNKAKGYVNVTGSPYQRVLDNIGYLLDAGVQVSIRMNMDAYNTENLKQLIEELSIRFGGRESLSVYCAILYEKCGSNPMEHTSQELSILDQKRIELEDMLRSKNLIHIRQKLPSLQLNQCMADSDYAILINPLGSLGKCEHYSLDHLVGSLTDGITDQDEMNAWKKHRDLDTCTACPHYPACVFVTRCEQAHICREGTFQRLSLQFTETMLQHYHNPALYAEDENLCS